MAKTLTELERPEPAAIIERLNEDGAVIVHGLLEPTAIDHLRGRLEPLLAAAPFGNAFGGRTTRRLTGLITAVPECHDLILNEAILGAAKTYLKPWSERLILYLTQAIELHPGQSRQAVHRDRLGWGPHLPREVEPQFTVIWAITDFTAANGATRLVPGSHHWPDERRPQEDEFVQATMPAGSAIVYNGSVLHGGGENRSDGTRLGLFLGYCLSWLRSEENQYLSCPPAVAQTLPLELQQLAGYTMSDYGLGYFGGADGAMMGPECALGLDWHTDGQALSAYIEGALQPEG